LLTKDEHQFLSAEICSTHILLSSSSAIRRWWRCAQSAPKLRATESMAGGAIYVSKRTITSEIFVSVLSFIDFFIYVKDIHFNHHSTKLPIIVVGAAADVLLHF
jgi:hypothetical protein